MQPPQPGFGASVKGVRRVRRTVRQAVVQEHAELGKPQNRLLCAATATQILRAGADHNGGSARAAYEQYQYRK